MKRFFALVAVLTLTAMLMVGCGGEKKEAAQSNDKSNAKAIVPYEIHSVKEDMNTSLGGPTYQVDVVVKEPANVDQLKGICQSVAEEVKKTHSKKVSAILIGLYDYPEYIGYGYVLGKAVQTSDGSWQWSLKEKDWSKRLTPEEVKIWAAWQKLYKEKQAANPEKPVDEKTITAEIAKQFGVQSAKVDEILTKQLSWSF